jgi:hypothetical protein
LTEILAIHKEILYWLKPATRVQLLVESLPANGAVVPLAAPVPDGLKLIKVRNTGSQPLFLWFYQSTRVPVKYVQLDRNETGSWSTNPREIWVAGSASDPSPGYRAELWTGDVP